MSTLKKTDFFLGDCAFAHEQILKPETVTQWKVHQTRDARYEAAWRNEKVGYLRSRVEHTFGKMMLGRFQILESWTVADRQFLYDIFALCCLVVEVETCVDHGGTGGDRYVLPFDPSEATVVTEDCPSFRRRYQKKIAKDKSPKAKAAKAAAKAAKAAVKVKEAAKVVKLVEKATKAAVKVALAAKAAPKLSSVKGVAKINKSIAGETEENKDKGPTPDSGPSLRTRYAANREKASLIINIFQTLQVV